MYKLCKTEHSARRQQQIEEGLLSLMLQRRYEEITVSDLCEKLQLPRKSFYRYFGSKEDALYGLLDHRLMTYETEYNGSALAAGKEMTIDLHWFFEYWVTQKDLLDALERSGISGILVERAIHNSRRAASFDHAPDGYSKADIETATGFIVCGLMSIVLQWHHDGYRQSPREMAETAYKLLSRPMIQGLEL